MLKPYHRHEVDCEHRSKGQAFSLCDCPIYVYGQLPDGTTVRCSLRTRDWPRAQRRMDLLIRGESDTFLHDARPVTLHAAIVAYTADLKRRKLAPSTLDIYGHLFHHLEAAVPPDTPVSSLDTPAIDRFCDSRTRKLRDQSTRPIEATTQRKEIGMLRAFFAWCLDRKWTSENPAKRVRMPKVERISTLPFTADEVTRLILAADRMTSDDPAETPYIRHRARALVYGLLYSGLRISDVAKLRRPSLDRESRHLTLRVMKTGVRLKVQLHPDAVTALDTLPAANPEYFFWSGRGALNTLRKNLARSIARLGKLADVKARAHRFRDTFAVELLSQGADIRTVQMLLGHESMKTTEKHYAHFIAAHQKLLDSATATLDFSPKPARPLLMKPPKNRRRNA